jgi:hypothetical protein
MIRPMMGRRTKPKKFDIPLRYYNPEEDEKRKKKIRIKTRSLSSRKRERNQNMRILVYAAGLAMVIYIISIL